MSTMRITAKAKDVKSLGGLPYASTITYTVKNGNTKMFSVDYDFHVGLHSGTVHLDKINNSEKSGTKYKESILDLVDEIMESVGFNSLKDLAINANDAWQMKN